MRFFSSILFHNCFFVHMRQSSDICVFQKVIIAGLETLGVISITYFELRVSLTDAVMCMNLINKSLLNIVISCVSF